MAKSRVQQAAIAISMKKAGKVPKGYHKMPDGKIMKDSDHKMQKGGSKVKSGPDYRHMPLVHWTDDYNTKKDSTDYKKGYYQGVNDIKKGKPKSKTLYNPQFGIIPERLGYSEAYERNKPKSKTKTSTKMKTGGSTPAWQRKEGKSPSGGLNAKGRASLKAEGHDIKAPQPEGGPRKKSFCARMSGMKKKLTSAKTANDPNSRINKSLRKWKC